MDCGGKEQVWCKRTLSVLWKSEKVALILKGDTIGLACTQVCRCTHVPVSQGQFFVLNTIPGVYTFSILNLHLLNSKSSPNTEVTKYTPVQFLRMGREPLIVR